MTNILSMTPEEAQAFIRKVMGPPKRVLEGQERENIWTMILLQDEPFAASNNQRFITEVYKFNKKEYHVHYGVEDNPIIEEIMHETNS